MPSELANRKRLVVQSYARYMAADRAWAIALAKAAELVPDVMGRGYWRLGTSRSRLRRLYLERDRALNRMMAARTKLSEAKRRASKKRRQTTSIAILVDLR